MELELTEYYLRVAYEDGGRPWDEKIEWTMDGIAPTVTVRDANEMTVLELLELANEKMKERE